VANEPVKPFAEESGKDGAVSATN